MIDDILFSIAGKKANEKIDLVVSNLLTQENIPSKDKSTLIYTVKVAEEGGNYPDKKYYKEQGYEPVRTTNSMAEIKVYAGAVRDQWNYEALRRRIVSSLNEAQTHEELHTAISDIIVDVKLDKANRIEEYVKELEPEEGVTSNEGFKLNISEIDQVTGGFQDGTVASIAAFTGQGKSTLVISATYKNIKAGKSGILFSIEVAPDLARKQFYSRWLYEEKGIEMTPRAMMDGSLDEEQKKIYHQYMPEFNEFIRGRLLIVDEAVLTRRILVDFRELSAFYKEAESYLESVDFVIYDHIGQVELLFDGMGNTFIKTLTSATKTFLNSRGRKPVTIMCVQTNRQGLMRAQKRNGKYDLQAISDLNEVERSSFYCVMMYTSDDMKLLQETKVMLLKHRLGALVTEPVSVAFNPASFVVGETVETVSFLGNLSFLNEDAANFAPDAFDDFE